MPCSKRWRAGCRWLRPDIAGNEELVVNGETGILVPVEDAAALQGSAETVSYPGKDAEEDGKHGASKGRAVVFLEPDG